MKVYQSKKGGWQLNFSLENKQHQLYLGQKHTAESACRIAETISELLLCRYRAESPPTKLLQKTRRLDAKVRQSIRRHGLLDYCDAGMTLGQMIEDFFEQKGHLKESSLRTIRNRLTVLQKFFGTEKIVTEIDLNAALSYRQFLCENGYAPVTTGWMIRICRELFKQAMRRRLVYENPFLDVPSGPKSNDNNYRYVSMKDIETILRHTKDEELKFAVRLARYAGLRMCSEIRLMKFSDFETDSFFVQDQSKTGRREVPFFHELRPSLDLLKQNRDKDDFVFRRPMVCPTNLHCRFVTIIRRAGFEPWPRLFNNLRASRVTELDERGYNAKTLDSIFGNTETIRNRHYVGFRKDVAFMRLLGEKSAVVTEIISSGGQISDTENPAEDRTLVLQITCNENAFYP